MFMLPLLLLINILIILDRMQILEASTPLATYIISCTHDGAVAKVYIHNGVLAYFWAIVLAMSMFILPHRKKLCAKGQGALV